VGYDKCLIQAFFVTFFLGVNITFFPIHFTGLRGAPRKYLEISPSYTRLNAISTLGSTLSTFALCFFIRIILESLMSLRVVLTKVRTIRIPNEIV
jgi:heme/copper-type cytochrome/quinol oxidase subunit 1